MCTQFIRERLEIVKMLQFTLAKLTRIYSRDVFLWKRSARRWKGRARKFYYIRRLLMKHKKIYGSTPHLIAELFISRPTRKYCFQSLHRESVGLGQNETNLWGRWKLFSPTTRQGLDHGRSFVLVKSLPAENS